MNRLILLCNKELPGDMNRQIRILKYITYYKATEFRTILLYIGMVIFKDLLEDGVYEHFLRFCLTVRICSCKTYVQIEGYKELARTLFSEYCTEFIHYYGEDTIVSNIHLISHIAEDVDQFGPLNEISTYPFENYLREIKYRVTASGQPIEQIVRRMVEISLEWNENRDTVSEDFPKMKYELNTQDVQNHCYKFIQITPNVWFSIKKRGDRFFLTQENEIVEMKFAIKKENSYFISGAPLKDKRDFFTFPYASHFTDIYLSNGETSEEKCYNISDIKAKLMCVSYHDDFVFIPLLHSFDEL